jgi:hypothetical protein
VILKQQGVVKKLLKKGKANNNDTEDEFASQAASVTADSSGSEATTVKSEPANTACVPKVVTDYDGLNDSDSAIMLEDNVCEVSFSVPNLRCYTQFESSSVAETSGGGIKVTRSISDVVKVQVEAGKQSPPTEVKQLNGRKTKEERRISNRQKLLSLKRHSGFLKRPEILETVYSVEEDGESAQQQQQQQLQQQQQQRMREQQEKDAAVRRASLVGSPGLVRRCSGSSAPTVILTGFRKRLDSDMTTYSDCSTDEESTRLLFSETESGGTCCSCSQPCSRRSSCGYVCQCMQCGSVGAAAVAIVSASAPASRRSSYGSSTNVVTAASTSSNVEEAKTYNRVMSNHRTMTKPKDVKFKRINKAKSRSLEELRGKLKWPSRSSSTNEDELDDLDDDDEAGSSSGGAVSSTNRLGMLREMMRQQKSLSLDQESTDISTN